MEIDKFKQASNLTACPMGLSCPKILHLTTRGRKENVKTMIAKFTNRNKILGKSNLSYVTNMHVRTIRCVNIRYLESR